jgi:NADH-quinone oxidoreductase subunit N
MEPLPSAFGLRYLLPELGLVAVAAVSMFVHLFGRRRGYRWAGYAALAGLALVAVITVLSPQSSGPFYSGHLVADPFARFFKLVFLLAAGLAVWLSFRFFDVEGSEPGEIYYLLPLTVIGMMAAVSSLDLVSTYVSFELFAIPSYILAGVFKKDRRSAEAGIKYFFLGTLSSGVMLLGMALIFGLTGETNYGAIHHSLGGADLHIALTGMVLFLVGLFFKAALVPFHMWAPDVYEGAPTPLVVFLSTAPKAAVFAILVRLLAGFFDRFEAQWIPVLQAVSLLTMFWGNIAALIQENVKRLMAYSSIAQAGYLAIGLAAWGETGRLAVLFYVFVYVFMNAAAFGMVLLLRKNAGFGEDVSDLRGLARRSPLAAGCILVLLLSLTGIPPTAGFIGKYFLFAAAVEKGMVFLAVAGAVNSVISLFYYFRLGRAMFMEEESETVRVEPSAQVLAVIGGSALILLLLGILPFLLTNFASAARLATG